LRNNQVSHRVSPIEFSLVWYRRLTPQNYSGEGKVRGNQGKMISILYINTLNT